jgi:hypothetical protein
MLPPNAQSVHPGRAGWLVLQTTRTRSWKEQGSAAAQSCNEQGRFKKKVKNHGRRTDGMDFIGLQVAKL